MKAYTLISGRPIGRYPEIYLIKPKVPPALDSPWSPEVEEWDSVEDAFKAVFNYCPLKEYRDNIRVISTPLECSLEQSIGNQP